MKRLIAAIFITSSTAQAEPIDIQKISKKQGWSNQAEGSYEYRQGFDNQTSLSGEVATQFMKKDSLSILVIEGEHREKNGEFDGAKDLEHFRYRRSFDEKMGIETFFQRESNTSKNLQLGLVYGTGPYYKAYRNYFLSLTVGASVVHEIERYIEIDPDQVVSRIYSYGSLGIRLPSQFIFTAIVQSEPNISSRDDHKLYTKSTLKYKVKKNITWGFKFNTIHDTRPATGTPKTNREFRTVAGIEF